TRKDYRQTCHNSYCHFDPFLTDSTIRQTVLGREAVVGRGITARYVRLNMENRPSGRSPGASPWADPVPIRDAPRRCAAGAPGLLSAPCASPRRADGDILAG